MLRSLIDWNRRRRAWNADHRRAWADATLRGDDGLSALQRLCEKALTEALAAADGQLTERTISDAATVPCLRARVAGTGLSIWLYNDTVGFDIDGQHARFEEWDYRTPEALAQAFADAALAAVRAGRAGAV